MGYEVENVGKASCLNDPPHKVIDTKSLKIKTLS